MLYVIQCAHCETPLISADLAAIAVGFAGHMHTSHAGEGWLPPFTATLSPEIADAEIVDDDPPVGLGLHPLEPGSPLTIVARSGDGLHALIAELKADADSIAMTLGPSDRSGATPGTYLAYIDRADLVRFARHIVALVGR